MTDIIIAYLGKLGIGGLFIAVFIESLGIPFPGGLMLVFAGYLISLDKLNFLFAFLTSVAAYTMGSSTAFYLGKNVGEPFLEKHGKYLHLKPESFNRAQRWLHKSSAIFILVGRFIPMISNITPYAAGISDLSWKRFLFYNSIFVMVWSALYISLGIFLGRSWTYISESNQYKFPAIAVTLIIIIYIIVSLLKHKKILKYNRLSAEKKK